MESSAKLIEEIECNLANLEASLEEDLKKCKPQLRAYITSTIKEYLRDKITTIIETDFPS